jgi:hypothetical protein
MMNQIGLFFKYDTARITWLETRLVNAANQLRCWYFDYSKKRFKIISAFTDLVVENPKLFDATAGGSEP